MPTTPAISDNLATTRTRITTLENAHARTPNVVRLLAVSKRKPAGLIREAAAAGQQCFGENYADEGAGKIQELAELKLEWHFIGHIQSNKTRLIATHYDWVQSIDREKTIHRLATQRPESSPPLNVCLQVNIDGESTKSGCTPDEIEILAAVVSSYEHLVLRGIMAIPAPQNSPEAQRRLFFKLHDCYKKLRANHQQVDTLSMGMSGDMEAAIAEGATMVRIGTAIFGARD